MPGQRRRTTVLGTAVLAVASLVTAWALLPSHPPSTLVLNGKSGAVEPTLILRSGAQPAGSGVTGTQVLGLTLTASSSTNNPGNGNGNASGNGNVLTDSRNGLPIFQATNLRPGGTPVTGSVTLSVQGSPSIVSLSESHLVSKTCVLNGLHCPAGVGTGTLADYVILTITDTTTSKTIYNDVLSKLGTPKPLTVCGTAAKGGSCPTWDNKEAHILTFTVTFPSGNVNPYQGTSTSVELDWTGV